MKDPWQKTITPYEILHLGQTATRDDIMKAFKAAFGVTRNTKALAEAHKLLQEPLERAMVDLLIYPDDLIRAFEPELLTDPAPLAANRPDYYLKLHKYLNADFADSRRLHGLTIFLFWTAEAIEENRLAELAGSPADDRAVIRFDRADIWKYLVAGWAALQTDSTYLEQLIQAYPGLTVEALATRLENHLINKINHWAEQSKQAGAMDDYQRMVSLEASFRTELSGARHLAAARVGYNDKQGQYHRGHFGRLMLDRLGAVRQFRELIESMLQKKPGDPLLLELLDELSAQADLIQMLKNKQYDKVIETIQTYPETAYADVEIVRTYEKACLEKGKLLLEQGQWADAFAIWKDAQDKLGLEKDLARTLQEAIVETVSTKVAVLSKSDPPKAIELLEQAEKHGLLAGRLRDQFGEILALQAIHDINDLTNPEGAGKRLAPKTIARRLDMAVKKLEKAAGLGSKTAADNLVQARQILTNARAAQNGTKIKDAVDEAMSATKLGNYSAAIQKLEDLRGLITADEQKKLDEIIASVYNSWGVSELNRIQGAIQDQSKRPASTDQYAVILAYLTWASETVDARKHIQKACDLDRTNSTFAANLKAAQNLESQLTSAISQAGGGGGTARPAPGKPGQPSKPAPARKPPTSKASKPYKAKKSTVGQKKPSGCLIAFILIALVVAGISIANGVSRNQKEKKIQDLITLVPTLARMTPVSDARIDLELPTRYFIVQNKKENQPLLQSSEYSSLYFDLPDNLKATTPTDLNTVVQIYREQRDVGNYTDGGDALQWIYQITVVDYATGRLVDATTLTGSEPPQSKSSRGDASGSEPRSDALDYLKELAGN